MLIAMTIFLILTAFHKVELNVPTVCCLSAHTDGAEIIKQTFGHHLLESTMAILIIHKGILYYQFISIYNKQLLKHAEHKHTEM